MKKTISAGTHKAIKPREVVSATRSVESITVRCRSCGQKSICKGYPSLAGRETKEIENTIKYLRKSLGH